MTEFHDFQDLTDPRMNEASWRAHDLLRAYAARDHAVLRQVILTVCQVSLTAAGFLSPDLGQRPAPGEGRWDQWLRNGAQGSGRGALGSSPSVDSPT